jgi:hypothetical protein
LDILGDKEGSLEKLIGELQGFRIFKVTGSVVGTTVPVRGIRENDVVKRAVVFTSATIVIGSTQIGRIGEGVIAISHKQWGIINKDINFTFRAASGSAAIDFNSEGLQMNSTGYSFEIILNTGSALNISTASANAIVSLINSDPRTSLIVDASTASASNFFSTMSFTFDDTEGGIFSEQKLYSGIAASVQNDFVLGGSTLAAITAFSRHDIHPSHVSISSGAVNISTAAPITSFDAVELTIHGYREE